MSEWDAELAELVALTREHLRWEMDLGSRGLPELIDEVRAERASRVAKAGAPPAAPSVERAPAKERAEARPTRESAPREPRAEEAPPRAEESAPREPIGDRRARLALVEAEVRTCTKCRLHEGRTQTVFARGNPDAALVFVGEGPGFNEDKEGKPFVGKAGQLLDRMIAAMGFSEDEVYICNVVKCRPPENRTPNPDEAAACMPFLRTQLEVVAPKVIVALGRCAAENLGVAEVGKSWRGVWGTYEGIRVMPTYHPAYLLRNPENKRPVWQDLQEVVLAMGREIPAASRRG